MRRARRKLELTRIKCAGADLLTAYDVNIRHVWREQARNESSRNGDRTRRAMT